MIVVKPRSKSVKALTEVELEMMQVIWSIGPCSVSEILSGLAQDRQLAYTSVSTIVRILEQKGFVTSFKEGRGHKYNAALTKESYQNFSLQNVVQKVFDGAPTALVRQLLGSSKLSQSDLAEIKKIISQSEG